VRSRRSTPAIALLSALLALFTFGARRALAPEVALHGTIRDPSWLPDGRVLRLVTFGQRLVVSDLYWLQTVQYMGEGFDAPERGWAALRPLVEIVTDLDPRHGYAYQMTGLCLADPARRLDDAFAVLQKGMRNLPERYSLPLLYGQLKYLEEKDYKAAAEYIQRAATLGKRPHLALLAATLLLKLDASDEYRVAAALLEETIPQTEEPVLRRDLEARLVRVRTYEALSAVEKALSRFRSERKRLPTRLGELVAEGYLPSVPADPSGGTLRYHPTTGDVESTVLGPRKPFP